MSGENRMFKFKWTKQAIKDWKRIERSEYVDKVKELLCIIEQDPYQEPPKVKMLSGNLKGICSRRINQQHRLTYMVFEETKEIRIIGMLTHYHE